MKPMQRRRLEDVLEELNNGIEGSTRHSKHMALLKARDELEIILNDEE